MQQLQVDPFLRNSNGGDATFAPAHIDMRVRVLEVKVVENRLVYQGLLCCSCACRVRSKLSNVDCTPFHLSTVVHGTLRARVGAVVARERLVCEGVLPQHCGLPAARNPFQN